MYETDLPVPAWFASWLRCVAFPEYAHRTPAGEMLEDSSNFQPIFHHHSNAINVAVLVAIHVQDRYMTTR